MTPDGYEKLWARSWRRLAELSPLLDSRHRAVVRALGPALRPGARGLDVGCGDGRLLQRLLVVEPRLELAGIDGALAAVEHPPEALRGRLRQGDVAQLEASYPGQHFDFVCCSEVLEHLVDPAATMKAMAALLVPGGVCVVTVPGLQRYWSSLDENAGHVQRFEVTALRKLFVDAGLEVTSLYGWGATFARAYYRLSRWLGPQALEQTGRSVVGVAAAAVLRTLFLVDDHLPLREGFQLVAVGRRP
jgi:SAM-dependent methyltransferase